MARMIPITDDSLKIDVPVENKLGNIRTLLNKEEVGNLIKKIPEIEIFDNPNKMIENEYRTLISDNTHESLIKILKTTYLRNKERIESKRKVGRQG